MTQGPHKKVANRLVVMSSAAVLAVYAAGFVRTQAAADLQEEQASKGRSASRPAPEPVTATVELASAAPARAPVEPRQAPEAAPETPAIAAAAPAPDVETPSLPSTPSAVAAAPVVVEQKAEPAPAPVDSAPPATPAPPAKPVWRDGAYKGWGTSRHGDIQAMVVIEGGRIVSASISQCETRYPCDIIEHLPPQVVQRQSPDVDSVSRATESADALYYGVVNALTQAK